MIENPETQAMIEETWHTFLTTGGYKTEQRKRRFFRRLPGHQRCKACYAPFQGVGSNVVRVLYNKRPSVLSPFLCNTCEDFARTYPGGTEIELSLLFADVRGSTTIAESMSPMDFHKLINRFYSTATQVMANSDALIDKIIGDQVAGMYVPGFAGEHHACRAIEAAQEILEVTGHNNPDGPWISLGVGVHTGTAFVGSLGSESGTSDITVLGDTANTAARLSTNAGIGEILVSQSAYRHAGYNGQKIVEQRQLELKGKSKKILVNVVTS
ncbi:MAG: adenylate/guanylate cyclase domain-containing protein [Anaerolineales bacterium]|nr:adenylate/guanylate cyclase domain-containing protein [Chloroflexota bacterium]MBL6982411.1 adenylate/guanylate cyclase domain-containing protein [Anaerolineales bacterium]